MSYCPFDLETDPETLDLVTKHVETHYGSVAVRVSRQRTSDTATLYIHGVGADWATWTPLIRAEAENSLKTHDQIFIDMPGFGDSENKLGSLEIADVGATFLSVVSQLGYSRVRVVGHSMGGFLTLDMASRYPEQIESIHLIAGPYFSILRSIQRPFLSFGRTPAVSLAFGTQYALARTGNFEVALVRLAYRLKVFRFLLYPYASHPFLLRESVVKALCDQINPHGFVHTAVNGYGYDAAKQWAKVECSIWAVFGDRDRMVPRRDMLELIKYQPRAHCRTVEDAGHLLHIEHPTEVLRELGLWN